MAQVVGDHIVDQETTGEFEEEENFVQEEDRLHGQVDQWLPKDKEEDIGDDDNNNDLEDALHRLVWNTQGPDM